MMTDLQNVSFMSLDERIGKIEVDPKEEASVVEVFQDVHQITFSLTTKIG
jgi:hypothetical protein